MIHVVYTIEEVSFEGGVEQSSKLLRFRDKDTRDKYLKNVILKHYKSQIESKNLVTSFMEPSKSPKREMLFEFKSPKEDKYYRVATGVENIEIIETLADDNQLKLEL